MPLNIPLWQRSYEGQVPETPGEPPPPFGPLPKVTFRDMGAVAHWRFECTNESHYSLFKKCKLHYVACGSIESTYQNLDEEQRDVSIHLVPTGWQIIELHPSPDGTSNEGVLLQWSATPTYDISVSDGSWDPVEKRIILPFGATVTMENFYNEAWPSAEVFLGRYKKQVDPTYKQQVIAPQGSLIALQGLVSAKNSLGEWVSPEAQNIFQMSYFPHD